MARAKKDGKKVNYYLDSEILRRFDEYCEYKGQSKTLALERILKAHLDEFEKEKVKEKD